MKKKKIDYFNYFNLFFAIIVLVLVVGCTGTSPIAPIINSFLANPTSITVGDSSNLSWSVTDATTVTIDQSIGSVALISTTTVSPATTTTYTLTATNASGSVTATTTITVNPVATAPTINSFSALPSTITVGESSTLSWSVTDAITVVINQSVGSVASTGTTAVTPATTTTYTLTATNASGSVTATTTITVNPVATSYGTIDIKSTPIGAKVYIDGVDTGSVTPYVKTHIESGIHTVKLEKFHYKTQEDSNVYVNAEETTYLNWAMTYASTQYVTLQPGATGIDTGIESAFPASNYAPLPYTGIGNSATTIVRTYIKFSLSSIPADAIVTDADLKLYQYSTNGTDNFTIELLKINNSWGESTICWDLMPTLSSDPIISSSITAGATTWNSWDIDDLVQAWLDGDIANYGVVLKDTNETSGDTIAYFYTSDYTTDTTKCPKLEIDYYIP